jgi:hypothetical protein
LKYCLQKHPWLTVTLKDTHTEKPFWEGVSTVNLENHISLVIESNSEYDNETRNIESVLPNILDQGFQDAISPPWRIAVLPLPPQNDTKKPRCYITFVFNHCIGDGGAGLLFHLTFIEGLQNDVSTEDDSFVATVPSHSLPDAFDTPDNLPTSSEYLSGIAKSNLMNEGTWTGPPVSLKEGERLRTRIRLLEVDEPLVEGALRASRAHGTKLTGTLHQLIVRALSKSVQDSGVTNFTSITATDLRRAAGVGLEWGIYVSGVSSAHARVNPDAPLSDEEWESARNMSTKLAEGTKSLQDQFTGLVRFIPNQRESMTKKLGARRDCSYAVSNMGTFDPAGKPGSCRITKMVNLTSALVPGPPLSFSLYSIRNGSLIWTISWQPGALGVDNEDEFIENFCSSILGDFKTLEETS